jgi:hypothetical protein
MGVEIQMSARSDLIIIDVVHLRDQINAGMIDVGVLVTPFDALSVFLTDRAPADRHFRLDLDHLAAPANLVR